jgi:hypothetical protein
MRPGPQGILTVTGSARRGWQAIFSNNSIGFMFLSLRLPLQLGLLFIGFPF